MALQQRLLLEGESKLAQRFQIQPCLQQVKRNLRCQTCLVHLINQSLPDLFARIDIHP